MIFPSKPGTLLVLLHNKFYYNIYFVKYKTKPEMQVAQIDWSIKITLINLFIRIKKQQEHAKITYTTTGERQWNKMNQDRTQDRVNKFYSSVFESDEVKFLLHINKLLPTFPNLMLL